jgi:hypothetical protein
MLYTPANWYWIVAGSTTQVYSSAKPGYVTLPDATYSAWLANGGLPTNIDSDGSLQGVLLDQYPAGWWQPLVPQSVSNFQARAQLLTMPGLNGDATLFTTIDKALAAGNTTPSGMFAYQAWENAAEFTRSGTLIASLASNFGLTSAQLDAMFIAAARIVA